MKWILETRKMANNEFNKKVVWKATELISFNSQLILKKLKYVKIFTNRFIIFQKQ
jgi:hypothetical protein